MLNTGQPVKMQGAQPLDEPEKHPSFPPLLVDARLNHGGVQCNSP